MEFLIKFKSIIKGNKIEDIRKNFQEKRYFPRVRCFCEAKGVLSNKRELRLQIIEISLLGIRVKCEKKLSKGEIICVEPCKIEPVFLDKGMPLQPAKMKVVWSKKKKGEDNYTIGLCYADGKKNLQDSWIAILLKKYGISVGIDLHKRRNIRIPVDLALTINRKDEFIRGKVRDIGISGMLIEVDRELREDEELKFRIGPYKHLQSIICKGRIAHKRFISSSKKWVFGIVFVQLNEKQEMLISKYLSYLCTDIGE